MMISLSTSCRRIVALLLLARIIKSHGLSKPIVRRTLLEKLRNLSLPPFLATAPLISPPTSVAQSTYHSLVHISSSWSAVDGLNSLQSQKKFVSFDESAYRAMVNDASRTPLFERAIINRLQSAEGGPKSQTVLDLGTGPYALFAIMAAKAGAGQVFAIEANREAAAAARETVDRMGYRDRVTVLEGFSTDISLPDGIKADFAVAEIVGSIASEEGAYASVLDAGRLIKDPTDERSWIPRRIQTYAAPASYTLHNLFLPPAFDWGKLNGEPVRFNCRDEGLQLLSDPMLVEDIDFAALAKNGNLLPKKDFTFIVDGARVETNMESFLDEFKRGRLSSEEAVKLAETTAHSLSGIALWPRLILDQTNDINSRRYPDGGHQKSHWQTVLPIMADTPVAVTAGDRVEVRFDFEVPSLITEPARYRISGNVVNLVQ